MSIDQTPSHRRPPALLDAVAELEAVVAAGEDEHVGRALAELGGLFGAAGPDEQRAAGPRLAALLPGTPPFPRAHLAMMVGACVEQGADPVACAGPVLAGLRGALTGAQRLVERWARTGGGELPDPMEDDPAEAHARIEDPRQLDEWHAFLAVAGWWTLHLWQMAAFAVYAHPPVRAEARASGVTEVLLELIGRYEGDNHDFRGLTHLAQVLDDEPLLVLDRPSGTGYLLRMSGLSDTFQLHTLLADVLIGGGHLPGAPQDPEVVALARTAFVDGRRLIATGAFNLVAPDGSWLWNEGTPADVPLLDGVRTLVLEPLPYERTWTAGRFLQELPGDLRLERVLDPAEAARLLARTVPGVSTAAAFG
ncbi:hypothetical protein [Streptomyces rubellomurinus]|uniref:DUF5596 domain-containing protein n=1 Tax=Streptomyces sp. Y1 TaxID=3238634 RepID=A0AB39TKE8_9ACTN|nr:hypothetical protein [Streptomyces rubellomurinus]